MKRSKKILATIGIILFITGIWGGLVLLVVLEALDGNGFAAFALGVYCSILSIAVTVLCVEAIMVIWYGREFAGGGIMH